MSTGEPAHLECVNSRCGKQRPAGRWVEGGQTMEWCLEKATPLIRTLDMAKLTLRFSVAPLLFLGALTKRFWRTACILRGRAEALERLSNWENSLPDFFFIVAQFTFSTLCVFVCVFVHACVCMCFYVHVCFSVCVCAYVCVRLCVYMFTCLYGICVWVYVCVCLCMWLCLCNVCVCVCVFVCMCLSMCVLCTCLCVY